MPDIISSDHLALASNTQSLSCLSVLYFSVITWTLIDTCCVTGLGGPKIKVLVLSRIGALFHNVLLLGPKAPSQEMQSVSSFWFFLGSSF